MVPTRSVNGRVLPRPEPSDDMISTRRHGLPCCPTRLLAVIETVRPVHGTGGSPTKKSVEQREIHSEGAGIDREEVSLAS